ncbi:MAG: phosphoribosylformylglycinamidine cyclo-ligase [Pseudomonadota bacterium]
MSHYMESLNYHTAGVDIEQGNALVEAIKPVVASTRRAGVLGGLGGFGGLFELPTGYQQPVLVAGTDGVGTKLKLAMQFNKHDTVGIDLVAMCANDILVQGAEPLFFLDYYATSKLDVDTATAVVKGIGQGCELAGMALLGGETAEMPGMYDDEDYDLAGFAVGIVEKNQILDGSKIQAGDALIGLASSGVHSNGYSLIRKIIELKQIEPDQELVQTLLEPTRIYVKSLLSLRRTISVHGMAHITGGGLLENIPRILPEGLCAEMDCERWSRPDIFRWLQQQGNIKSSEMMRTFNCGLGMVICVAPDELDNALQHLAELGETAWHVGNVVEDHRSEIRIENSQAI